MKNLKNIPMNDFHRHDEAGTLGDSDEITERDLKQIDNQLKPFGLELVVFENGSALNWFIQKK
jgi:hypothetical protein